MGVEASVLIPDAQLITKQNLSSADVGSRDNVIRSSSGRLLHNLEYHQLAAKKLYVSLRTELCGVKQSLT